MRIDGTAGSAGYDATHAASGRAPARGQFQGEQVTVRNELSSLSDAAEELTFHFAGKRDRKASGERAVEAEPALQLLRTEEIAAYLRAAHAFQKPGDMVALVKRFMDAGQSPRQVARQASDDPTQQFLLLQLALHEAERGGASAERREALREALAELELASGPAIRAGLNSIDAASGFGHDAASVSGFQNTYRDVVLGAATLADTLRLALARFAEQDFERGLAGLLKALGADLAAARPSTEPARLQALVQDVYQLEVFNTLLHEARQLAGRLADAHGVARFAALPLLQDLVGFTAERWIGADRFLDLPARLRIAILAARIGLLTQALRMLREMPGKVYPDPDTRQAVLQAGQEALDQLIEEEENEAEDGGDDDDSDSAAGKHLAGAAPHPGRRSDR